MEKLLCDHAQTKSCIGILPDLNSVLTKDNKPVIMSSGIAIAGK